VSTTDADGIEDAVKGSLRVATTAAARAGEHLAAMRAQELRRVAHEGERAAEELRARHEAHWQAARAVLQDVHRADWWATATAADIGRMYREATAWARVDPEAARAAERIVTEVKVRYGDSEYGGGAADERPRRIDTDLDGEAMRARDIAAKGSPRTPDSATRAIDRSTGGGQATPASTAVGRSRKRAHEIGGR
jgi:hypothetical protein